MNTYQPPDWIKWPLTWALFFFWNNQTYVNFGVLTEAIERNQHAVGRQIVILDGY